MYCGIKWKCIGEYKSISFVDNGWDFFCGEGGVEGLQSRGEDINKIKGKSIKINKDTENTDSITKANLKLPWY